MVSMNENVQELLEYTDLVLLDIKHIDDEKCKALTGVSNKLELEFARYLSEKSIPIWIRQVVIPGITDDEEDLLKLKEFINSLKTVERIELFKYHTMGKFKWEELRI
jgi:pyruvate formate lyase activating enzyme